MEEFPKLLNPFDYSVVPITSTSFSIGRSLSCDHIIQSLNVSRFHCCIKKNNNKWTLYDRSSNGTMVNSTLYKFNESIDLNCGDVIKLGPDNVEFVFKTETPDPKPVTESVPVVNNDMTEVIDPVCDPVIIEEFQHPLEIDPSPPEAKSASVDPTVMENELTCSICSELFIKAVTLNCSHTFCKFCIEQWKKNKANCPICRKIVISTAPTLVLDNFIEKFIESQTDEVKETRKTLIQQREEVVTGAASSSNVDPGSSSGADRVIQIYSDNEDEESNYSENYSDDEVYVDYDEDDYDEDYDGSSPTPYYGDSPTPYYGGYGRCFICNQAGHWANTCPFKRR